MIMIKKVVIALLLTVGFVSLIIPVNIIFDKNTKNSDTNAVFASLAIGVSSFSITGYLLWADKRKREQEKLNSLRKLFFEVIESSAGKINSLQFAKKVTLSGKANLSGNEATLFLDKMVKEFGGNRDVSQKGTIYYDFDLQALPYELLNSEIVPDPNLPIDNKTGIVSPTSLTKQNTNNGQSTRQRDKQPISEPPSSPPPRIFNPLDPQLLESLEDYLSIAEWQKADEVTAKLMLKVANQSICLTPDDITQFPYEALSKIDELWQIYSNNHFGFLAQAEVFNDCFSLANSNIILDSKNWQKYGQALGWYLNAQWPNHHNNLRFSLTTSPKGYLPFLPIWQGTWWGNFIDGQGERFHLLIKRVKQCRLSTHVSATPSDELKDQPMLVDIGREMEGFGKELKGFFQREIGQ